MLAGFVMCRTSTLASASTGDRPSGLQHPHGIHCGERRHRGPPAVERMLSVVATCRHRARLDGSRAPSLLPGKAMSAAAA